MANPRRFNGALRYTFDMPKIHTVCLYSRGHPCNGYDVELRVRALDTADALADRLFDEAELDAGEDQPFQEVEE